MVSSIKKNNNKIEYYGTTKDKKTKVTLCKQYLPLDILTTMKD